MAARVRDRRTAVPPTDYVAPRHRCRACHNWAHRGAHYTPTALPLDVNAIAGERITQYLKSLAVEPAATLETSTPTCRMVAGILAPDERDEHFADEHDEYDNQVQ